MTPKIAHHHSTTQAPGYPRQELLALIRRTLTLRRAECGPALPVIALAFARELASTSGNGGAA